MFSEPERKRSLQFLEFSFWESRSTRTRLSTLRNKFRASKSFYINRSLESREVLAVSDGELNSSELDGRGSDQSLNSLPSAHTAGLARERSVASWAVSFERLLQDPLGVDYFTEFLKKEYSAENIFFWKACEKFQYIPADYSEQLSQEARRIYNEYLSSTSLCPVNVDRQALITEEMLGTPSNDMFRVQQLQIFNLMKFDSYARFVKSPLYQECMLAEVEGRPLNSLNNSFTSPTANCSSLTPGAIKKNKLRSGKSLPIGVEGTGVDNVTDNFSKPHRRSFKKKDRRGHCTESSDSNGLFYHHESRRSLNSTNSLDLSFISSFSSKSENDCGSLSSVEHEVETKPIKYCCVYLPDGTASLTAVKPGLTIRDMLAGICEKRGYCLTDIKVYLAGKEQALVLDQECIVLTDQEVRLENRISFHLEIVPAKKSVRITAKSAKTLRDALQPVLKKYGVDSQHVVLTKIGESQVIDQESTVNEVAGQRLVLETVTELKDAKDVGGSKDEQQMKFQWYRGDPANGECTKDSTEEKTKEMDTPEADHHGARQEAVDMKEMSSLTRHKEGSQIKYKSHRHTYDIEGLVEMLNRVQSSRADDQRGLLCKKDLVLPEFLKLPTDKQCDCCHMSNLHDSTRLLNTSSCGLEASQALSDCSAHTSFTNTSSPSPGAEGSPNSKAQIPDGFTSLPEVTSANIDTVPEEIISDVTFLHHPSNEHNGMCTEDRNCT
ncbi:regulator of G-protein signaling 14 isoform X2 [Ascaphus truei]|uniref:regulator of G-protein signaling 14 isoform X2 n=1 Tax=Ascaphus truei TaxID=8439 RepID=UPI003F5A30F1